MMTWYMWLASSLFLYVGCGLTNARMHSLEVMDNAMRRYYTTSYARSEYREGIVYHFLFWPVVWFIMPPVRFIGKRVGKFIDAPIRRREEEIKTVKSAVAFWEEEYYSCPRSDTQKRQMAFELAKLNAEKLRRLEGK